MIYSLPADIVVALFSELPTELVGSPTPIGAQVLRASNGTIMSARTEVGIVERPAGSGTYVVTTTAPAEQDTYLLAIDWSGGVATPATSRVEELKVTASIPVEPSGLGAIADAVKGCMGNTFDGLVEDAHYGSGFIMRKIEAVKSRVMNTPPITADEDTLPVLVIDYLGKLSALELMPAAFDYWAMQIQTESTGNDPTESVSYPDRLRMLDALQEALLRQTRRDELLVTPLLDSPRALDAALVGPAIDDSINNDKVTADPKGYPSFGDFPYGCERTL